MYSCKKCGCIMQDHQKFCANCGTKRMMESNILSSETALLFGRREFYRQFASGTGKNQGKALSFGRREYYRQFASGKMKVGFRILSILMMVSFVLDVTCTYWRTFGWGTMSNLPGDVFALFDAYIVFFSGPLNWGMQVDNAVRLSWLLRLVYAVCLVWMVWLKDWKAPAVIIVFHYIFIFLEKINLAMAGEQNIGYHIAVPPFACFAFALLFVLNRSYKKHIGENGGGN